MKLTGLTLLNPIDFYIPRILTIWKLGPLLQCLGAPYIVYRAMFMIRKIFCHQIILANCHQIILANSQNLSFRYSRKKRL